MDSNTVNTSGMLGFVMWLLWVTMATLVLGGVAYLFIGGSTFFSKDNTEPIVVYRQIQQGTVSLTGSVLLPSECSRLKIDDEVKSDKSLYRLNLIFEPVDGCNESLSKGIPETFFVQFEGDNNTEIIAFANGIKKRIIIK